MSSDPQRPQIPPDMKAFNAKLIEEIRANGGQIVSGPLAGSKPMILTTTGAKTFAERSVVIGYRPYGDRFAAIASNNGAPGNPHWLYNLRANPVATIEVGPDRFSVKARVADSAERAKLAKIIDYFERQQALTSREIPIVIFEKI